MNLDRIPSKKQEALKFEEVTASKLNTGDIVLVEDKPETIVSKHTDTSSNQLIFKTDKGNILSGEDNEGPFFRAKK